MIKRLALALMIAWQVAAADCAAQNYFNGGFSGLAQPQYQQRPQQQYQQQQPQQYRQAPQRSGTSTMAGLENVLNQVDNSNWNNVPVSGNRQPQPQMQAQSMMGAAPAMSGNGGGGGMFPKMSRREMTRIFFEGGSPMGMGMGMGGGGGGAAPPQNNSQATSTAYSNYQTACNEETKSRNYANTARYDGSEWNRKNAAEQAYYAANNANYAAQRAESAAYNGGSDAQGYARLARAAANRARENANRARYNADTIR